MESQTDTAHLNCTAALANMSCMHRHLEVLSLDDVAPDPRQIGTKAQNTLHRFACCGRCLIEAGARTGRAIHDALVLASKRDQLVHFWHAVNVLTAL